MDEVDEAGEEEDEEEEAAASEGRGRVEKPASAGEATAALNAALVWAVAEVVEAELAA